MLGIPLLENKTSFLVSWFLGFRFLGFLVSKIHNFKKTFVPYYQNVMSCFLIDIGLISKNFKILLDGSSGLFGACLFEKSQHVGF